MPGVTCLQYAKESDVVPSARLRGGKGEAEGEACPALQEAGILGDGSSGYPVCGGGGLLFNGSKERWRRKDGRRTGTERHYSHGHGGRPLLL